MVRDTAMITKKRKRHSKRQTKPLSLDLNTVSAKYLQGYKRFSAEINLQSVVKYTLHFTTDWRFISAEKRLYPCRYFALTVFRSKLSGLVCLLLCLLRFLVIIAVSRTMEIYNR